MTIADARLRALRLGVLVAICLTAVAAPARADDGTPPARAVPLARALPRTFASYDALISTAQAVANDQTTLFAQLQKTQAENDLAKSILASYLDPRVRGGLIRAESVTAERAVAGLRAELATTAATATELVAAGASAYPLAPTWQRPIGGEISQPFGPTDLGLEPSRTYKGVLYWHFHDGVDITDPFGTPIVAPARGRIVFAGRMMDGAEVVVIAHDDGLVSLFAHLDDGTLAPPVKAGDLVQPGDRIGSVGLTGMTTGYHLHWAVYQNGLPIDPLSTLGG